MKIIPYSVNRREAWDKFVLQSKNGTFLLQRGFMDYHADRFFDCSLMVYEGMSQETATDDEALGLQNLIALFPANWLEQEHCVCSHQGLTYGGLITLPDITQKEVLTIMQAIMQYYESFMQAEKLVYKPIPYIYSAYPSGEDLYALFRANARLSHRLVSTVVSMRNPLKMRTLRMRQARKAIDSGFYIDRMTDGDWGTLAEYWHLLEEVQLERFKTRPVHTFEEMKLLMQRFPREIKLYLVRSERTIVAGTLIFETHQVARVQYIASGKEGREHGALDLLFRHLVTERYRQMEYLDFGTSNEDGGRVLNEGLIFQKEGFGGRAVCYDTYEVDLDRDTLADMDTDATRNALEPIPFLDLKKINQRFEPELSATVTRVVRSGWYLLGQENKRFEKAFCDHCGARHCIPVGNGLEALTLILKGYKELLGWTQESEVIVPANTYIASILAVSNAGLTPVPCEPSLQTYLIDPQLIEKRITPRTVAIMPVHLYGRCCDMQTINAIAQNHRLKVVDDLAQAHGIHYHGQVGGHLCDATGISFYPGKNLGALGDAGAVTTDDDALAHVVRRMANYGSGEKYVNDYKGHNSRMDEVQAAVLTLKLQSLGANNARRRRIAAMYDMGIQNPLIIKPQPTTDPEEHVYHVYPVRCADRDALQAYLARQGIQTLVHYPIPPHKQKAYAEWNDRCYPITERIHREVLSLPISPVLTDVEVHRIIQAINLFTIE